MDSEPGIDNGKSYPASPEGVDGITVANFGDVMLLAFAQHLREQDSFEAKIKEFKAARATFEQSAREHMSEIFQNPPREYDLTDFKAPETLNEGLKSNAVSAFILRFLAENYAELYRPKREFDPLSKILFSVLNRTVTVEATDASSLPITKLKFRGGEYVNHGYIPKVKGIVTWLAFEPFATFPGDIRIQGKFGREYSASPLIDRKKGYTSTVKLTFEE